MKAEDFNEAIELIREWLPLAEAELKFRTIPDDEDGVIRWIENHEVSMNICAEHAKSDGLSAGARHAGCQKTGHAD